MATLANHHVRRRHGEHRLPASGPASGWGTPRPAYLPRRPTQTPLYTVVQHHLETFLAQAAEAVPEFEFDQSVPHDFDFEA